MPSSDTAAPDSISQRPVSAWRSGRPRGVRRRAAPAVGARDQPLRLLIGFGGMLILAIAAGTTAIVWHLREKAIAGTERELSAINVALSEQTARMFQGVDLVLSGVIEQLSHDGVATSADYRRLKSSEAMHAALRGRIAALPQLDAVTLIDADGNLVNLSRYWPVPRVNVADRDYFIYLRDHPSTKPFVSVPAPNRGTGTWTIYLARRVDGQDGAFLGVALGAIELKSFEELYQAIGLGEGGAISLWRRDGVLLARHPRLDGPIETIGRPFPIKAVTEVLPRVEAGAFRAVGPMDGVARVVATRALRDYPLVVNVSRTEAAVLAEWRRQALPIAGGGLLGALALGLSVWALARRFAAEEAADEATAARDEAESASRAKSEFLATMSHELRTPLNAIIGFSQMMAIEPFGPLGDVRYHEYARDIGASGEHLLEIINDILDIAKAEAGKLEIAEDVIEVAEVVEAACRLVRPRVETAGLSLSVAVAPDLPPLRADARKMKQILLNLLSNAVKFTPAGGRVEVRASGHPQAGLTIAVRDTGIGIAKEHLAQIARPFVQVNSSPNRRHEGTGLGLALVTTMMRQHGGALRLESELGRGTTAILKFPRERLLPTDARTGALTVTGFEALF